ncbi:MAG: F0F1 ATP synthase subunit gamma, partial [Duncaniella sp.]|nr:F0F1 ATP synthase subunit gamma [Duncaniella sp.]
GLLARIAELRETYGSGLPVTLIPVGRKLTAACAKLKMPGVHSEPAEEVNSKSDAAHIREFGAALRDLFLSAKADRIELMYMNFQSVSRQRLRSDLYLPVDADALTSTADRRACRPCIFEPDAETIFRSVVPMALQSTLQEVFTENRASEQAARIMAMQSANDNAKNLLEELQIEFNKLRQQGITNELLDILGGQVNN